MTELKQPIDESKRLAALKATKLLDTPPETGFDILTNLARTLFDTPIALITLVDESRQWFKSNIGLEVPETSREIAFCNHTIESDHLLIVEDATKHPDFKSNPLVTGDPNIRFYAGVPLVNSEGYAFGALCVIDNKPREVLSQSLLLGLVDLATLAIEQIDLRLQLGFIDAVTELPNRLKLEYDIQNTFKNAPSDTYHLIVADTAKYEQYAALIQSLGHNEGDKFLRSAATKLQKTVNNSVTLYNLSVYRFAWLVIDHDQEQLTSLLNEIQSLLGEPYHCGPLPLMLEGTVGYASYPKDATKSEELIRSAISALLDAKSDPKALAQYSTSQDEAQQRSFRVLCDLPKAIEASDQLFMVYQPKIDLRDGKCIGLEALIRWDHPELGFIPPDEFITLAENTAIITQITDWVIHDVFKQMAKWDNQVPVAINVSIGDLQSPSFVADLKAKMKEFNVSPDKFELEVTETAFMSSPEQAMNSISALKELGVAVSIDDFGTGQSNFSYLKYINAAFLKIDRTFVQHLPFDIKDSQLTSSIINIAKMMQIQVIAEGVENKEACEWLLEHDCFYAQGYYISKPLTAKQIEAWLHDRI